VPGARQISAICGIVNDGLKIKPRGKETSIIVPLIWLVISTMCIERECNAKKKYELGYGVRRSQALILMRNFAENYATPQSQTMNTCSSAAMAIDKLCRKRQSIICYHNLNPEIRRKALYDQQNHV